MNKFSTLSSSMQTLALEFKKEVCDRSKIVDPEEERDWYDLSFGYFLSKGLSVEDATTLACVVRYDCQYWC